MNVTPALRHVVLLRAGRSADRELAHVDTFRRDLSTGATAAITRFSGVPCPLLEYCYTHVNTHYDNQTSSATAIDKYRNARENFARILISCSQFRFSLSLPPLSSNWIHVDKYNQNVGNTEALACTTIMLLHIVYSFRRIRIASGRIINCKFVKLNFASRHRLQISAISRRARYARRFSRAISVIKRARI